MNTYGNILILIIDPPVSLMRHHVNIHNEIYISIIDPLVDA